MWPTMVEDALQSHRAVELAVAFGVPDPLRCSTDIRAMVKLKDGYSASPQLEEELLTICKQRLKDYEVPTRVTFRDTMPVTLMGKVDRKAVLAEIDEKIRKLTEKGEVPEELR